MSILKQIRFEIRNILKSKFILIMAILIMAVGLAVPIILTLSGGGGGGGVIEPTYVYYEKAIDGGIYYPEPGKEGYESITVNGITIYSDNPYYWNLQSLVSEKANMETGSGYFKDPASLDLMLKLIEEEIGFYLNFAQNITSYEDYRSQLAWNGIESLYDKFFLENNDVGADVLTEVAMFRKGLDMATIRAKYIDITAEEKLAGIDFADENLTMLEDIVVNGNFPKFIELRIRQENATIKSLEDNIAIQEQAIIDNPDQEEYLNQYIEDMKKQIALIKTKIGRASCRERV